MLPVLLFAMIGGSMGSPFARDIEEPDCSGLPDSVVWHGGCASYGICSGGQYRQTDCYNGTVVDPITMNCIDPADAPFPCFITDVDCTAHVRRAGYRLPLMVEDPTGVFPVCACYVNCVYGNFRHIQWCPPGTIYDERSQQCRQPGQVPPPCGFAPPDEDDGQDQTPPGPDGGQPVPPDGPQTPNNPDQPEGGDGQGPPDNARDLFGTGQYQQGQQSGQDLYGQQRPGWQIQYRQQGQNQYQFA